jgi:hypothetical protein
MVQKKTTTTPDPELYLPEKAGNVDQTTLDGDNARGEVAACPTGLGPLDASSGQQPAIADNPPAEN